MKVKFLACIALTGLCGLCISSCNDALSSNTEMVQLLSDINHSESVSENPFYPEGGVAFYDSVMHASMGDPQKAAAAAFYKSRSLLQLGKEQQAASLLDSLLRSCHNPSFCKAIKKTLAIAWLRIGERTNCIFNHSSESCVFPVVRGGIHTNKTGSSRAIELYEDVLREDSADLESRWLLNIAYMTTGEYPAKVPATWLLKGLDASDTTVKMKPFEEMAVNTGLDINNMAGGSIVEDFDNDGNLDIITSSWGLTEGMHYCKSNGNGTFTNLSALSGLRNFTGGLNIMQTDYNNDGLKDVFVLRGAWKGNYGKEPMSLLRNNGDGTFTDVTKQSGLLRMHPTQTATWADFNNDGWLDVFVGTESTPNNTYPCELYINNKNGTFTEVAAKAGVDVVDFIKGVNSGDFNNDGLQDIVMSSLRGEKRLLRNDGIRDGCVHFTDVADQAGIASNHDGSFSTWFWDYDNDGWQDIVFCNYEYKASLAVYAAAEALQKPLGNGGQIMLFRNDHNGHFTNVTQEAGLNKVVFAMGANFGDIDNDGYPDMYFGTGNPLYQSLIPNKLFKNVGGKKFADVTSVCRVGNLQKGHGVSIADIDNDGDADIYIDMGGAYVGDAYQNLLYINPGQNTNNWLSLDLIGTQSNKAAIGARIKVTFMEKGKERSVYTTVNSGGSFGSNPLRQHIGLGPALRVDSIEIKWPGSGNKQLFTNIAADAFLRITEGSNNMKKQTILPFAMAKHALPGCAPQ